MEQWPHGFWETRAIDAIGIVVINDLPIIRDTLFLRLLGRDYILRQALDELRAMPVESEEVRMMMPVLLAFWDTLPEDFREKEEPVSPLQEVRHFFAQKEENARQQGLRAGLRKGRRAGKRAGQRQFLLRQLEEKFSKVPDRVVRRVKRAEVEQLETWGKRVLFAGSLDEIFV